MALKYRYRHLVRIRQVANVMAHYGFGYAIDQLGLGSLLSYPRRLWRRRPVSRTSRGRRLVEALESLGPTFVKLGQMLSTRSDLLPLDMVQELAGLQDQVDPFPFTQVREKVEEEFGRPLDEVFASFEAEPLAAASIGQVHRACLPDGCEVVVKVQRPGIGEVVRTDLEILGHLATLADRHHVWGNIYDFSAMARQFSETLTNEMDYRLEGHNADRLRRNLSNLEYLRVPKVYWDYTSTRVLTLEYVPGVKLSDYQELDRRGYDRHRVAVRLAEATFQQILIDGFFHADPHPGNLAVQPGEVIVLMDFGMVGRLSEQRRDQFINLVLGLVRRSSEGILKAILKMGLISPNTDLQKLRLGIDRLRDRYYDQPFKDIDLGQAIQEILSLAFENRVTLPAEFTLVAKTLITLEGIARDLDPDLNIVTIAEPLAQELLLRRYDPRVVLGRTRQQATSYLESLLDFPLQLHHLLERMERNELRVRLQHEDLEGPVKRLERGLNNLVLSFVLLSFTVILTGSLLIVALRAETGLLLRWPLVELGLGVATFMALALVLTAWQARRR